MVSGLGFWVAGGTTRVLKYSHLCTGGTGINDSITPEISSAVMRSRNHPSLPVAQIKNR